MLETRLFGELIVDLFKQTISQQTHIALSIP